MHTTNYANTFIAVADDCPVDDSEIPGARDEPTIASLHYELIAAKPYALTSDEIIGEGRVALVAVGTPEYQRLLDDPEITHTRAMRSRRV